MKMSSLPEILETGINVFISSSQIITIKTYYEKSSAFGSLLILLLSVASIGRNLLKTTRSEERSVHINSESCNIQLGS